MGSTQSAMYIVLFASIECVAVFPFKLNELKNVQAFAVSHNNASRTVYL